MQPMSELRPFISLIVIIISLLSMVFLKMETRMLSYSVLKQSQKLNQLQDRKRELAAELAQAMQPDRMRRLAVRKLSLQEAGPQQIIYMLGEQGAPRY